MATLDSGREPTRVERWFARERFWVAAGLVAAVVLAWAWLVPAALDMYDGMQGAAAWMVRDAWSASYFLAMFGMWSAMMLGMMLPSAAPTLLLYGRVLRHGDAAGKSAAGVYAFACGYLLAWTGFSLFATFAQAGLSSAAQLTPMMQARANWLIAGLLFLAGAWQFTPWKRACLGQCRSPAAWIARAWRRGSFGALRMGLEHGAYCLGCCWALMLLLFAGGVMNLAWIAAITVFVLVEKLLPIGRRAGQALGIALLVASLGIAVLG